MTAFNSYICSGDSIQWEQDGFTVHARIERDDHMGAPWEEHDGHGEVSDWTSRAKLPGELVLNEDRGSYRYYDFQGACHIARCDGWDAKPYNTGQETKRQQAAKAARADYENLRAWCDDEWWWCGVVVTVSRHGVELATESLWGIESNAGKYLTETAQGLAEEAIESARAKIKELVE